MRLLMRCDPHTLAYCLRVALMLSIHPPHLLKFDLCMPYVPRVQGSYRRLTRSSSPALPQVKLGSPEFAEGPARERASSYEERAVPRDLLERLTDLGASQVRRLFIEEPESLNIIAPHGNEPQAEVLYNTNVTVQYSLFEPGVETKPPQVRLCIGCASPGASVAERGWMCRCGEADGCSACVGQTLECPSCRVQFTRRWAYGSSHRASLMKGHDPAKFAIFAAPSAVMEGASFLQHRYPEQAAPNSVVLVLYTGPAFCAKCTMQQAHQKPAACSSSLALHRDFGSSSNSQKQGTTNRTISIGHQRHLSLQLMAFYPQYIVHHHPLGHTAALSFPLTSGSIFQLAAADEVDVARKFDNGDIFKGSWFHGIQSGLQPGHISAGYVYRTVISCSDVNINTNFVIMSGEAATNYQRELVSFKSYGAAPSQFGAQPRADWYRRARERWRPHSLEWSQSIAPQVEASLNEWSAMLEQNAHKCARKTVDAAALMGVPRGWLECAHGGASLHGLCPTKTPLSSHRFPWTDRPTRWSPFDCVAGCGDKRVQLIIELGGCCDPALNGSPAAPFWGRLIPIIAGNSAVSTVACLDLTGDEHTVGRLGEPSLKIVNPRISTQHAKFELKDGQPVLTDLSTNGTWVNGVRLGKGNEHVLKTGDTVAFIKPAASAANADATTGGEHHAFTFTTEPAALQMYYSVKELPTGVRQMRLPVAAGDVVPKRGAIEYAIEVLKSFVGTHDDATTVCAAASNPGPRALDAALLTGRLRSCH